MKVVYIAGPFTASTHWQIELNVRHAESWALFVATCGAMPLCPHTNTRFFHGLLTPEFWYEGTIELLKRADAVLMVQGWELSVGCRRERDEALKTDKPVFYETDPDIEATLKAWVLARVK
jgi:hypothetical protein